MAGQRQGRRVVALVADGFEQVEAALSTSHVAGQNTRAFGTGHHRNWTFPMMYLFGTNPQ